ncbi:group 1 glycosyl transferase [Tolypothrix tenuis PCC 7101]|uniref:Group 1 glycosyl transferase n=1 Tax=Tolypothrix tenuis PCC 7101 TaxID=231146 RepID=A0A1Z4N8V0_9CYAN|nr:glycosyltransferase family 4 protein [Aulosira sp. FACHB-113]BAZ02148.1 group 1 glycosyl transferase [Tolypothrix tenuis PCC 7101]BAZ73931.1 group 1 glycosyl transferase [Aulosira laxa NIES-50]
MTNSKLRVLFVSHAYVVGVNQGKLNAIAQTGQVEIGLLTPSNWKALEWNRQFEVEKPYPNIQVYTAPVMFSGRGGAHVYTPWHLWQVLQDFQPDIVQVEEEVFSLCTFELAIWSRITGKPMVVFGWENMDRSLPIARRWVRQFVMNTAKLMLPGNQDGANLLRQWGYTGLMEVMPQMGVDTQLFSPRSPENKSENKNEEFHIGFLGRLVPEKGVDTIFGAARLLKEKGLNTRIIICGSGSYEEVLKQEAQKQQIADLVVWRGSVRHEQAPEAISKFDVLVLPSLTAATWKEQFGHVLIEAMAMGVPVVGSSSGEIANVIARSDLVFPEGESAGLATILERMIRNPNWRQELKQHGMARVNQHYSHERIAERLINLWQPLIRQTSIHAYAMNKS